MKIRDLLLILLLTLCSRGIICQDVNTKEDYINFCNCIEFEENRESLLELAGNDPLKINFVKIGFEYSLEECSEFATRFGANLDLEEGEDPMEKVIEISNDCYIVNLDESVLSRKDFDKMCDYASKIHSFSGTEEEKNQLFQEFIDYGEELEKGKTEKEVASMKREFQEYCSVFKEKIIQIPDLEFCDCQAIRKRMQEEIDNSSFYKENSKEFYNAFAHSCTEILDKIQDSLNLGSDEEKGKVFEELISSCDEADPKKILDKKLDEYQVDFCSCVEGYENMQKQIDEAGDDESKISEIEASFKWQKESCEKFGKILQQEMKKLSDEDKAKKMKEMMDACK